MLFRSALTKNALSYEHHQLLNAGHLYASTPLPLSPKIFQNLIDSGRPIAKQLGWQLAAMKPSPPVASQIEQELTRAVSDSDEESVMIPQMANAVRANRLKGEYTLLRQGLLAKGDEEFAVAMIALDPKATSDEIGRAHV